MPVKYITNERSLSKISYNKLEKVAEKVEDDLKAQKNGKLKNEYSKLNNSDSVVEICKKYFKKFHKDTYQLWEKSNFEKNYCINFKDNTKNSTINSSSFTLLQMFSHFKCVEAVRALLQEGANVNEPNKSGRVALHDAVIIQSKKKKEDKDQINASIEITKLLLAKNADIYIEYEYRKNALPYLKSQQIRILNKILKVVISIIYLCVVIQKKNTYRKVRKIIVKTSNSI